MKGTQMGSPVWVVPDDCTDYEQIVAEGHRVTTENGLRAGVRLMCLTVFGYALGVVSVDEHGVPSCASENGKTTLFLEFTGGYWGCFGSGNVAAIKKLMVTPPVGAV